MLERIGPKRMDDPRFGRITFLDVGHAERNYWEALSELSPVENPIEFLITADSSGPTQHQRDFVRWIESRWSTLEPRVAAFVTARGVPRFPRDFALSLIEIPGLPATPVVWQITYEERESGELVEIELENEEPTRVESELADDPDA
jgi:hypothetical protein